MAVNWLIDFLAEGWFLMECFHCYPLAGFFSLSLTYRFRSEVSHLSFEWTILNRFFETALCLCTDIRLFWFEAICFILKQKCDRGDKKFFLAEFRLTVVVDLIIVIDWLIFCHFTYILIGCTFSISIISWGFDFDFLYLLIVFTHGMLIFSLLSIRLLAIWVWSFQLFFFFLFTYKSVNRLLYSFFCLHAILAMFSHANGSDPSFITIWTSPGQLKMFCINFLSRVCLVSVNSYTWFVNFHVTKSSY